MINWLITIDLRWTEFNELTQKIAYRMMNSRTIRFAACVACYVYLDHISKKR